MWHLVNIIRVLKSCITVVINRYNSPLVKVYFYSSTRISDSWILSTIESERVLERNVFERLLTIHKLSSSALNEQMFAAKNRYHASVCCKIASKQAILFDPQWVMLNYYM